MSLSQARAAEPGGEFLSDAPFSNLVSARRALFAHAWVGGVKLLNPKVEGAFLLAIS